MCIGRAVLEREKSLFINFIRSAATKPNIFPLNTNPNNFSFILANTNPKTLTILYSSSLSTISTKYPNISPSHAPLYCFHHTLPFIFLYIQFLLLLFPSFSRSQSFLPHPIHIFLSREQIAYLITSISSDTVF